MRHIALYTIAFLISLPAWTQQAYTARVVDAETGEPLPYATIYLDEGKGTLTNSDGNFTIEAQPEDVLQISYIGYNKIKKRAKEIGTEVRLEPMSHTMSEVTVIPVETVLSKMISRLNKEYSSKKHRKGHYFYRLKNEYGGTLELLEAYMNAHDAANLRNIAFLSGRRFRETQFAKLQSNISYSNLQHLLELGIAIFDNTFWYDTNNPFRHTLIPYGKMRYGSYVNKENYSYSGELIISDEGQKIYKIGIQGTNDEMFIDGTVYVDADKYTLLCFEGKVHNCVLDVKKDLVRMSSSVEPSVRITYKHDNGYTEVESLVATMKAGDLKSHSVAFNLGDRKLPFKKGSKTADNMLASVDAAGYDPVLWQKAVVQRTEAEEQLVNSKVLEKEDERVNGEDSKITAPGRFGEMLTRLSNFGKVIPQEKVYIHMDNTCYFQGDTIWFAAYTRQTTNDKPSRVSRVLYAELLNNDGYLVERKLIEMQNGRGQGFFALNNPIQYSGFYELRAYTRWQLNWGKYEREHQDVHVGYMRKVMENRYLDYEKLYSRVFPVYDRPREEGDYARNMTLRNLRRYYSKNPDTQRLKLHLYPEGGNLVAGVPNRVAFEATLDDGEWQEGTLFVDETDSVRTVNRGRGIFIITPEAGKTYEATFVNQGGEKVSAKLPKAEEAGVALSVEQDADEFVIRAMTSQLDSKLAMTIMHEGRVEELIMLNSGENTFRFVPSTYYAGVHQVTVFDGEGRVWADRLFFSRGRETFEPNITITGLKEQYGAQQPIVLDIQAKAQDTPISLAVRDRTNQDFLFDNANILTEMLLSSEIRGFVPDPGWFFEKDDVEHRTALDLLMMIQGWRRFNWRDMAVKGEWDLTEPDEQSLVMVGRVDKYETGLINGEIRLGAPQRAKETDENSSLFYEEMPLHQKPKNELRVHAELISPEYEDAVVGEVETKDGRFKIQLPRFYGKSILHIGAADTTKWTKEKQYTWAQTKYIEEEAPAGLINRIRFFVEDAEYLVRIRHPYPRFAKRYSFYQNHLSEAKEMSDSPPELLADGTHLMREVPIRARHGGLRAFDDSQPALVLDAYDAYNRVIDEDYTNGDYEAKDIDEQIMTVAQKERLLRLAGIEQSVLFHYIGPQGIIGSTGDYTPIRYGIGPTRRAITKEFRDIPPDSIFLPKYLESSNWQGDKGLDMSPGEMLDYDRIGKLDKFLIYTDYAPRLYGDKRYSGSNATQDIIAVYPYYDGSQRPEYRDRCYVLDGFAYPAEFYSPNYSRYQLPDGQKDYRRTLYWNPSLQLDGEGKAHVVLFNNSKTTQVSISAAGQAQDGTLLWK